MFGGAMYLLHYQNQPYGNFSESVYGNIYYCGVSHLSGRGVPEQQAVYVHSDAERVHEPALVPLPHVQAGGWCRDVLHLCQGLPQGEQEREAWKLAFVSLC